MRYLRRDLVLAALAVAACAARAEAQQPYAIQEMNFDMWCQEEKHLPANRCDKRLPEDDAAFQAYRSTVENYEINHLQQQQSNVNLNTDIIHNDPLDNPSQPLVPKDTGGKLPCSGVVTCTIDPPPSQTPGGASAPQN